jgi:DNA-binding transcriptional regulator YiaG
VLKKKVVVGITALFNNQPSPLRRAHKKGLKLKDKIKANRKKKGLTQRAFAELLGVTTIAVCHWESGNRIPSIPALLLMTFSVDELKAAHEKLNTEGL